MEREWKKESQEDKVMAEGRTHTEQEKWWESDEQELVAVVHLYMLCTYVSSSNVQGRSCWSVYFSQFGIDWNAMF